MIPLYYAYVAFSNLSMVSTVMGLYLEHVGFSLAGVGVLFSVSQPLFGWLSGLLDMRLAMVALLATSLALLGAVNLAFSHTDLLQKEARS